LLLLPLVYAAAWLLKGVRRAGVQRMTWCRRALFSVGVFPIRRHYYEPQFDYRSADIPFSEDRRLPGIDLDESGQLEVLDSLIYAEELLSVPREATPTREFYLNNNSFGAGDAEYWYQIIRARKPRRIIEIGSGNSTLMAVRAIKKNSNENPSYQCEHTCIEPYEMPWLEQVGVSVIRRQVEHVDLSFFSRLSENDVLFIDSSHVIRPQGDVLYEYLEILPTLRKGVIVHIHDILTPKNYPSHWLKDEVRLWNEQYLVEAFLTHNRDWRVLGALNYLAHHHASALKQVAPLLSAGVEPCSLYLHRIN
jgi:predicted O-methyltransferase YrrM